MDLGQIGSLIDPDPNQTTLRCSLLENRDKFDAPTHHRPEILRLVGWDVSELDATLLVDRDGLRIDGVLGFGAKIDQISGAAQLDAESAGGATLVGICRPGDRDGDGAQSMCA